MNKKLHEKLITKLYFPLAHKLGWRKQRPTFTGRHALNSQAGHPGKGTIHSVFVISKRR